MKMIFNKNELLDVVYDFSRIQPIALCTNADDHTWDEIVVDAIAWIKTYNEVPRKHIIDKRFENCERPDVIYRKPGFIMGIECFQFDSSMKTRKGSAQKVKEREIDRIHNGRFQNETHNMPVSYKTEIDPEYTLEKYQNSFLSSFTIHVKKLDEYRENINNKYNVGNSHVLMSFYVEDVTSGGSYIKTAKGTEPVVPYKISGILQELDKYVGWLDYLIIKYQRYPYIQTIDILKLDHDQLNLLLSHCYKPEDEFISYRYSVISDYV